MVRNSFGLPAGHPLLISCGDSAHNAPVMGNFEQKAAVHKHPQCVWCDVSGVALGKDHVFPRALGGTKELWVPACNNCQTKISKAEGEAARQSNYSLFCLTHGPPGRDKRKPGSGVIRARYLLVKNPLGGYGEAAIRAGRDTPEALPHIEIDVRSNALARRRGPSPASVERLVTALKDILSRKPDARGFIGELEVRTDRLPEIGADTDFWPRVVLDLSGHLYVRARDPNEALRFVEALISGMRAGAFAKDYSAWTNTEIIGGSPHWLALKYDRFVIHRVVGKIACGLMYLQFGAAVRAESSFRCVRDFVLGDSVDPAAFLVTQLDEAGTQTPWKENHVAFICRQDDRTVAMVSVYGDCHIVQFGAGSSSLLPDETEVAMCRWDGKRTRMVPVTSVPEVAAELKSRAAEWLGLNGQAEVGHRTAHEHDEKSGSSEVK
jgi:hypothetical protein